MTHETDGFEQRVRVSFISDTARRTLDPLYGFEQTYPRSEHGVGKGLAPSENRTRVSSVAG
eukprot:584594-Pelagomonas_calceolata.AAC.1